MKQVLSLRMLLAVAGVFLNAPLVMADNPTQGPYEASDPAPTATDEKKDETAADEKKEETKECQTVCYDDSEKCKSGKFHSKVKDGYYSDDPRNMSLRRADRTNNPGAVNTAGWIQQLSCYMGFQSDGRGNNTAIFDSPECGVAVQKQVLTNYSNRMGNGFTIRNLILLYANGNPDLGSYIGFVSRRSGYSPDALLDINDASQMLPVAKAMFRYESGQETKLSDAQIAAGWNMDLKKNKVNEKDMCDALGKKGKVVARRSVSSSPGGNMGGGMSGGLGGGMGLGMPGMGGGSMGDMMALLSLLNGNSPMASGSGGGGSNYGWNTPSNPVDETNTKTVTTVYNTDGTKTVTVTKSTGETLKFTVPLDAELWMCGKTYEAAPVAKASEMVAKQCYILINTDNTPNR